MNGFVDDLCGDGASGFVYDVGMTESQVKDLVGELFDCLDSNDEAREYFLSESGGSGAAGLVDLLFSDRASFIEFFLSRVRSDAVQLADLQELVSAGCR